MSTVLELAELIQAANARYYVGDQSITDAQYDAWKAELRELDPAHPLLAQVGAPVPAGGALRKARHMIPMGSLANAFTEQTIEAFVRRVTKLVEEAGLTFPTAFVVQPKGDGLSIDLRYDSGTMRQAITRGDGVTGEDVTHNLMRAQGVPHNITEPLDISVRGETMLHRDVFAAHFAAGEGGAANARASAAGTCRRLDGDRAQHLHFYAFGAVAHDGKPLAATEAKLMDRLAALGFDVMPTELVGGKDVEEVVESLVRVWREWKDKRMTMPFDCDGVVVKVSHIGKSAACGESDGCPRAQLAMKWPGSMSAETEVVGLHNSIGRTGAITPVAIVRPVMCGGVSVTRISLANWDEVVRLGVGLGAKVAIERAGEVIPKVVKVLTPPAEVFQRPAACPACGCATVADAHRQLCVNAECSGQAFRKVLHWVTKRVILHLGEEAVDKLMALDGPVQRAADLYTVTEAQLAEATGGFIMARKVGRSLESSRDVALHEFVGSVGVPGLGATDALSLCRGLGLKTLDDLLAADPKDYLRVRGFGPDKAAKIHGGLVAWADDLRALEQHLRVAPPPGLGSSSGPLSGRKVCITGATTLARALLVKILTEAGAEYHSSVVRDLDYLVMADANSGSTKARAARDRGIQTIGETEILAMVGYG